LVVDAEAVSDVEGLSDWEADREWVGVGVLLPVVLVEAVLLPVEDLLVDAVRLPLGVNDGDTLPDQERLGDAVGDGEGDGDGLHPVTTGAVRVATRWWPPTVSTSTLVAELYTLPQEARGVRPVHCRAEPPHRGRRQDTSSAVEPAELYSEMDDRDPALHFFPPSYLADPAPVRTQLLPPASF
jgi:hypothetical protein